MVSKERIKEFKAMGFHCFGTRNSARFSEEHGCYVVDISDNYTISKKISTMNFCRSKDPVFNCDPLGGKKMKKLFDNIWFETEQEAWEMVSYFVDEYLMTEDVQSKYDEYKKLQKKSDSLLRDIRRIRKSNTNNLQTIIDKWQFKEAWTSK
jgi:hypothetical protein